MRVLCDENVPNSFTGALQRLHNVDVVTVEDVLGNGVEDDEVRKFAEWNDCVVLTNVTGFLKTANEDGHGLLFFRQKPLPSTGDIKLAVEQIAMQAPGMHNENIKEFIPGGWV